MKNPSLKKFILKMQTPLFLETEGLGTIALCPWNSRTTHEILRVLEKEVKNPKDFLRNFVATLGRISFSGEKTAEMYENGIPIEDASSLTHDDLEKIASSYIEKYKNSILHWVSSEEGERDELVFNKEEDESTLEYFLRIIRLSVEKSAEKSKRLLEEMTTLASSKSVFEKFSENQFKIGSIADHINDIQNTYAFPSALELREFEVPDFPPNPVYETNELLNRQSAQLRGLSELLAAQGEQAVLLNDQTGLLIGQSNESTRQAKTGIWVAAAGVFLSTIVSGYAIYRGMDSSSESSRLADELVAIGKNNNELIKGLNELLQELNARVDAERIKSGDNTELLNQLRELTEIVERKKIEN